MALESGRELREDDKYNQKEIVRHAEKNSCSRLPRLSNRRDADKKQGMQQGNIFKQFGKSSFSNENGSKGC